MPRLPRPLVLLLRLAALLLATSVVTFALVGASPVDPVKANVGQASYAHMSAEQRAELEQYWGSTTPIWQRYAHWAAGVLRGDLGESLRFDAPVTQVVGERFANSAALMLAAWLLAGAGGLALGVAMGARRGSAFDCVARGACLLLSSTPAFWLGLVALMVFSVWLGWFPLGFSVPVGVDAAQVGWADKLRHLVLPAFVLAVANMPDVALHTREKTVDVLSSDYVRFARSRGEGGWALLRRHGLRNLVLPALTIEMASASEVFGGSVLVEQVFSYPGLGQAAVTAGLGGDAPLLVAIALVSALVVFVGNACADVLYGVVDPRVREGRQVRHG
ncbi:ABC transporter permease [uncultured Parolsenella sp.]|uniref:ABC transporter permease n=1 Tax=uncultured Parolsenella sp. TaxID=2083008 RepID=UPI0027DBD51D|nr:ABC transporter permease [uncultured Parolsenella sp.]